MSDVNCNSKIQTTKNKWYENKTMTLLKMHVDILHQGCVRIDSKIPILIKLFFFSLEKSLSNYDGESAVAEWQQSRFISEILPWKCSENNKMKPFP